MFNIVTKGICGFIISSVGFLALKNILSSDEKLLKLKNILWILLLILPTILFYRPEYSLVNTIVTFFLTAIVYKNIFNLSFSKSILASATLIVLTAISDIIVSSVLVFFVNQEQLRENNLIMLMSNSLVALTTIALSKIKPLKTKAKSFLDTVSSKRYVSSIVFCILSIIVVISVFYSVGNNFKFSINYIVNLIILTIFFVLFYIYIKERFSYEKLNSQYDSLFNYVQTFEEWIEDEQDSRHDLKNNLASLRGMTAEKELIDKIDEMLKQSIKIEKKWIEQLKYIPKGGLKGLLYYKLARAKEHKVSIVTEISSNVTEKIEKVNREDLKDVSKVVGIYLDNAIEAASLADKKSVLLEVYTSKNQLIVAISNTYQGNIDINKIQEKGVTTKGEGHGNGLYYANKAIAKNKKITSETRIINNYYVQKLIIYI